ncbi:MAG: lysozyme inhibitor LprI family protein [Bradyrhizobium sp.]
MHAFHRLATSAVAMSVLLPGAAHAADDFTAASSSAPMEFKLCGSGDGSPLKTAACKEAGYDKLVAGINKAIVAAVAKAPPNIKPLLKRDQAWFNEMTVKAAEPLSESDDTEQRESFAETLRQRIATLDAIAQGFGRAGLSGKWVNAFGGITVTPADDAAYLLAVETRAVYGPGEDRRRECKIGAVVKPGTGGWLSGALLADEDKPANKADAKSEPAKPPTIRLRRQGETLRVVLGDAEWRDEDHPNCAYMWQVTASYFAGGKPDTTTDKADVTFVAPTFDCTRLETATEEEICADPELADNDQRLNRAWKALLPRLDDTTRRALTEDQRKWVGSQAAQYPEFLHPAWEKRSSFMHFTSDARDKLDRLQRERIALIDGFDDKRNGLAGTWLAYNAVIQVTVDKDGSISAKGWKWDQGDWKAGCDYDMAGKIVGGSFRSEEQRKNPDTLERDHATLVVNRLDDVFVKKRWKKDGTADETADEAKCKRNSSNSSTARLFPARPSPDIDKSGGGSIR